MRQVYFTGGLVLGLVIAVFALQNTAAVELRFLLWKAQGSLAAVVLASVAAGLLIAFLLGLPEILTARWRIRSLEQQLGGRPPGVPGPPGRSPEDPGRPA